MLVGIPKEIKEDEKRVSLLPHLVKPILEMGHRILFQKGAGEEAAFLTTYISKKALRFAQT